MLGRKSAWHKPGRRVNTISTVGRDNMRSVIQFKCATNLERLSKKRLHYLSRWYHRTKTSRSATDPFNTTHGTLSITANTIKALKWGFLLRTPHGTTLHYTTLRYITLYYTTLHTTLHYTTLHYATLHYTTLHYTTLRYTTLHYTTLHYTTLHYTTLHYTILHYTTHYTTLHYTTLHYTTLHCNNKNNFKKPQ